LLSCQPNRVQKIKKRRIGGLARSDLNNIVMSTNLDGAECQSILRPREV
jgi:hypothetical protein